MRIFCAGARRACILGINPHPCHALHRPLDGQCYLYYCIHLATTWAAIPHGAAHIAVKSLVFGLAKETRKSYSFVLETA